jgi:hypothetical protein
MKATWVKATKDGKGGIYRFDTPLRSGDKDWEYAIIRCYKAETLYGLLGVPASSALSLVEKTGEAKYRYQDGPAKVRFEGVCLSHKAMLKKIGYDLI